MADIRLAKPAAGAAETVPCAPEARFVFDFPATDATLARDGDNLAIQFEDGSRLNLEGFYTEYNEENLPSFSIDGTEVAAADFFAAMNEPDLMPAAGPGAGTPTGGRFHEWGNASLAAGLDHLDGLDLSTGRAFTFDDALNAVGGAPEGAYAALAGAAAPGTTPAPDNPVIITPDEPADLGPGITGAEHTLHEKHLANGSDAGTAPLMAEGSLSISAPDGVASIMVGFGAEQIPVQVNGAAVSFTPAGHKEGTLTLRYDADAGRLEYTYTLNKATQEHGQEGQDESLFHDFTVTVTDRDGDSMGSVIRVNIEDDTPSLDLVGTGPGAYGTASVIGTLDMRYGADGVAATNGLILLLDGKPASTVDDGAFTFDGIGTIKIEANGDISFTPHVGSGADASHTLAVTITDGDRDSDAQQITFTVDGTDLSTLAGHATSSDADRTPKQVAVEGLPDGAKLVDGTYEGEYGTITVKGADISYVQNKKVYSHTGTGVEDAGKDIAYGADKIGVDIELGDGTTARFEVSVDITDDVPYGGGVSYDVSRGDVITGNIFSNDNPATAGADGPDRVEWELPQDWKWENGGSNPGSGIAVNDNYPGVSVSLGDDGSYTFTADGNLAGLPSSIAFDHVIYDKDGDSATGKLDFNPSDDKDIPDVPPLPETLTGTVSEAALPDGSKEQHMDENGNLISDSVRLDIPEEYEVIGGWQGTYGKIEQDAEGNWNYTLKEQFTNLSDGTPASDMGQDTLTLTLADSQGTKHTVDVKIDILDDAPVITGDDETHAVKPVTDNLFGEHTFQFSFGGGEGHDKYGNLYADSPLWMGGAQYGEDTGWDWNNEHAETGLQVSGWMYSYTTGQNGQITLKPGDKLQVLYSDSRRKQECEPDSISKGDQDGLTVGNYRDGEGYSSLEIGAAPGTNQAEGLCFDLGDKTAHSVTVNLGAFFSAGSGDAFGNVYDPIPERALLTFYDGDTIVKQMVVTASSSTGLYTETIDCYVAGGFDKFVVSALDNTTGMENPGNANSDFVVQSVEFHAIIGTATGKLDVTPGADGLHADMQGYAALFDLEAMRQDTRLSLEADGMNGFIAKDGDKAIFAASIDEHGNWTLTQFNHCDEQDITLRFFTQDGDNDIRAESVKVDLYHPDEEQAAVALNAPGDDTVVDDPADDADSGANTEADDVPLFARLDAMATASSGPDDDASFPGAGGNILVYDANDYLIDGGNNIDFLLTDKDVSLGTLENVRNVEVLLKGDDALSLTSMEKLAEEYGISMSEDGTRMTIPLAQGEDMKGWTDKGNGVYEHHGEDGKVDLTMETANLTVQEPASSEAEQAAHTLSLAQG